MRRPRPLALAAAALGLALATRLERGRKLDERLFAWANRGRHPSLDAGFRAVTELGSYWASVGAAVALAARGKRRPALDALGAATLTWGAGQALKWLIGRPRPYDARLAGSRLLIARPAGTSWPSSHPAVVLTFVTVAARDLGLPASARVALTALAGIVGWSRVHLGVHFPADVAGGLLLGRAIADAWSATVSPRVVGGRPPEPPGR